MRCVPLLLALPAWFGLAGALNAAPLQPVPAQNSTVEVHKDMVYGVAEGESLKLDLFLPTAPPGRARPAILFIHGGGWVGGDKSEFDGKAEEMAKRGYVAVTANYRLAPKHRFPAAVQDLQLAVRWMRSHADTYHLDPNRIGSMGASAGGHLASFLGVKDTWSPADAAAGPPSRVNCVVDYYGRMDLTMKQGGTDFRPDYIGKSGADATDAYREASPVTYVDAHTVPFLIVQGARDPQVWPDQSQRMLAALDKAGIESSLLLLGGQGHGFGGAADRLAWETAKSFLDAHLRPGNG